MTPAATARLETYLLDKLLEALGRKVRDAAGRMIAKKVGKRALGALAALLAPDPTITKLIALGMGIWAAWDLLDIGFWVWEMRRWLTEELEAIKDDIIVAASEMPDFDPDDPDWIRRIACILEVFSAAVASAGDGRWRESGRLTRERMIRDMERCLNL